MGILRNVFGESNAGRTGNCGIRRCVFAAILTPFIVIMAGCSGGSGGGASGATTSIGSVAGKICIESDTSYSIDLKDENPFLVEVESSPLAGRYSGSIGGQIRAVGRLASTKPEEPIVGGMIWGLGAALGYGTAAAPLGILPLKRPGAVTSLAEIRPGGEPMTVFATEGGIGIMTYDSLGYPVEDAGSFRPVLAQKGPFSGVISVDATPDGGVIVFATVDGYLQATSAAALSSGEKCTDVLASAESLGSAGESYMPVKVKLGDNRAFLLAKPASAMTPIAPTYAEAYGPIFYGLASTNTVAVVRSIGLSDNKVSEVKFTAADGSFGDFDGFIPTDIALDRGTLAVAGLAFRRAGVESFMAKHCSTAETDEQRASCLLDAAASEKAELTQFAYEGRNPVSGGFFLYRNLDDLSQADYFKHVPIPVFENHSKAPPFTFRIAMDGSFGYMRAPNFLLTMQRTDDGTGKEDWDIVDEVDLATGLEPGIPNDILIFSNGAASTFTAVKNPEDGSGASALEFGGSGSISTVDYGSVYVRVEGGGTDSGEMLVAAIEMEHEDGGKLFLENTAARYPIDTGTDENFFVSRADYDGKNLAFAGSSKATDQNSVPIRLEVRKGKDGTPKHKMILRDGMTDDIFKEFNTADDRTVSDVFLSKSNVVVLFTGVTSGSKRYFQPAIFDIGSSSLDFVAASNPIGPKSGTHEGKVLKLSGSKVTFSASDGIYEWSGIDKDSPKRKISQSDLIDAAIDPTGKTTRLAIVSGFKLEVRNLATSGTTLSLQIPKNSSYSKKSAAGAKVAIVGNLIFVSAPYGTAEASLLAFDSDKGSDQTPLAFKRANVLDVNIFEADTRFLMVSSVASGIEIYDVSTQ